MSITRRRCLLGALMCTAAAALPSSVPARDHGGTLYVFAITDIRPRALERMMQGALPDLSVRVFGRVGDFSRALRSNPPDAAMSLGPVLSSLGQTPAVQGVMKNSSREDFLLVSNQPLDEKALGGLTIGCIDLVGRRKLPRFVGDLLALDDPPKVQRVTKVEDLLRLLQFRRADAILLPKRFLDDLKARSRMEFQVLLVPSARLKRVGVSFPGQRKDVEKAIRGLPKELIEPLGIDGWR